MWLVIIIIVVILAAFYLLKSSKGSIIRLEGYDPRNSKPDLSQGMQWDPLWQGKSGSTDLQGKMTDDCYSKSNRDCLNYSNCGLCVKNGKAQCKPGDIYGAFFEEDCDQWGYMDYYDRHIFGDREFSWSHNWSRKYPEYEYWAPQRPAIAAL